MQTVEWWGNQRSCISIGRSQDARSRWLPWVLFSQKNGKQLGKVCSAIQGFFEGRLLLKELNKTFIVPRSMSLMTLLSFGLLAFVILVRKLLLKLWRIDCKIFSRVSFLLTNLLSFRAGLFKIVLLWLMRHFIILILRKEASGKIWPLK